MPLIRYMLGDHAVLSKDPCPCGRPGPILKKVLGRTSDTIRLGDGRLMHGEYFTHLFYGLEGVIQFRFVQHALDRYELLLVTDDRFDRDTEKMLREGIEKVIGGEAELLIQHVDRIEPLPSGKRQFVFSHLKE